ERAEKEQRTGKKIPGRSPKPPEPGPAGKDQVNFTDPESRIMPTSENGWQQAYNAQAAVDMDTHLIVGGHLSQARKDRKPVQHNSIARPHWTCWTGSDCSEGTLSMLAPTTAIRVKRGPARGSTAR